MSLDVLFRTQKFTTQYPSFAKSKLEELANKIILDEIHETMRSKNFSQKIIDSTYVKSVDITSGEIEIVSDYKSESGFDVAKAREEGTRDHNVKPKGKVLSWIGNGARMFSRGHWVKGLPEERIIEKTAQKKSKKLNDAWVKEQDKFFEEMLNGS